MNFLRQLLILVLCLAVMIQRSEQNPIPEESPESSEDLMESLDICEPKYREKATPAQVEAAYDTLLQVQDDHLVELIGAALDRFNFALEDSKDNETLRKKVLLEYYDKVCGVVDVIADMSEKVVKILS